MKYSSFKVSSPAKINLSLYVGNKRTDHYHNLLSLLVPLKKLKDILEFKPLAKDNFMSPCIKVNLKPSQIIQKHTPKEYFPSEENNSVWKAAMLFYKKANIQKPGMVITLHKNIPLGGGLGGGSSNAASTLMALNHFFHCPLSQKELSKLAKILGSDVSFFLCQKPAFIWGRGEKIKPLPFTFKNSILVLNPGFPISTSWAYGELLQSHCSLTKKDWNVKNYPFFLNKQTWKNDFEKVIFPKYPLLEKMKNTLVGAGAIYASLSGSGASLFGIFKTVEEARKAKKHVDRGFSPMWTTWMT